MRLNVYRGPGRSRGARAGRLSRALRRVAPSLLRSPVRRIVQAGALCLFGVLFFHVCWPFQGGAAAAAIEAKEFLDAETFLMLDPLVALASAVAARAWVWALAVSGGLLAVCLIVPRGFCGYLCPLGTLIDLFDWLVGGRAKSLRVKRRGWWVHLRWFFLAAVLVAAGLGVQAAGFVAAIPVVTRGLQFVVSPLQVGLLKGWHLAGPIGAGQIVSVALFALVGALGFLAPRFWCRYVCPTGAVFSAAALARLTGRKVRSSCISCGACAKVCSFDAIRADFTTRGTACTFCQDCGGACPTGAIQFVGRWDAMDLKPAAAPAGGEVSLARRRFLASTLGGVAAGFGVSRVLGASGVAAPPVRPPGSVPEETFQALCVRCGSCLRACPSGVLQPMGLRRGLAGLWTPHADTDFSGCDPTCNNCGHACPTGAIRALPRDEKRAVRMGLAAVNETTCLPHAGRGECAFCVEVCTHAGHKAIEFLRVGVEMDESGLPVEDTGLLAPVVLKDRCVGCGLCQARCHAINVRQRHLLSAAAIQVEAGSGKEDRILRGSYRALRRAAGKKPPGGAATSPSTQPVGGGYDTDF